MLTNPSYCSFCGKSQNEVKKLIAGPTVFICNEYVELCMDIIKEKEDADSIFSEDISDITKGVSREFSSKD